MDLIVVTGISAGGAPSWVLEAWKDCVLPYERDADEFQKSDMPLSKRTTHKIGGSGVEERNIDGYAVRQDKALKVLAQKCPSTVGWYRESFLPQPNGYFFISVKEAKLFEGSATLIK
jgi:hypothetical protein